MNKVRAAAAWFCSISRIFVTQIVYLVMLLSIGGIYWARGNLFGLPDSLGTVNIGVPFFGALGAVLISYLRFRPSPGEHAPLWERRRVFLARWRALIEEVAAA